MTMNIGVFGEVNTHLSTAVSRRGRTVTSRTTAKATPARRSCKIY